MVDDVRQQAITWTKVDQDIWHQMSSLSDNELSNNVATAQQWLSWSVLVSEIQRKLSYAEHLTNYAGHALLWLILILLRQQNQETKQNENKQKQNHMSLLLPRNFTKSYSITLRINTYVLIYPGNSAFSQTYLMVKAFSCWPKLW